MIQEIYTRDPNDPKYDVTKLDTGDKYEQLYTKILMILSTRKGEVLGDPNLGVSLEDKLFVFEINEQELKSEIFQQVAKYIRNHSQYNLKLDIKRFRGSVRDIILLDFLIDGIKSFGVLVK